MNKIEQYDIITLDNNDEYTVIKIVKENDKKYYLLAWIDENEKPDMENIKIVEEIIEDGKLKMEEIEDEQLANKLSKKFLSALRETME